MGKLHRVAIERAAYTNIAMYLETSKMHSYGCNSEGRRRRRGC
jgi:hypothetical protein